MDALLTSKCVKFIGSGVEWVEESLITKDIFPAAA